MELAVEDPLRPSKSRRNKLGDAGKDLSLLQRLMREARESPLLARLATLLLPDSPSTITMTEVSSRKPRALIAFCTSRSAASDACLERRTSDATCSVWECHQGGDNSTRRVRRTRAT